MGKNKNRNRRNRKNKDLLEPNKESIQINISSRKQKPNYNHSYAKIEVSFNANCTVEFPEIGKTQTKLNSLSILDSSPEDISNGSTSKHCKETSNELKKVVKEENVTGIVNKKLGPNMTRKAHPSFETNYNKKTEPVVENNYCYDTRLIGRNYVEETQASVKKYQDPSAFGRDETRSYRSKGGNYRFDGGSYRSDGGSYRSDGGSYRSDGGSYRSDGGSYRSDGGSDHSNEKSCAPSIPTMKGAKPKTETKFINSNLNDNFKIQKDEKDSQLFRQQIDGGVRRYKNHWDNFDRLYRSWISQRENTIKTLQELVKNVHKDQRMFNQGNVTLKEINVGSRELKNCNSSPAVDFLASLAAFVTDAASGVTSVIQACNADNYTTTFKEILENDAKITKPLHSARSQCLQEYRNVEEIIRQCHLETFGSTIDNISNTLNVDDLLSDIKNVKGENAVGQVIDSVGDFLKRNANMEVMGEVYNSIQDYLDSNPAALAACKSAGKALYGAYDTWGRDHKQGRASIAGNMSIISNKMLLMEERRELSELRSVADNDEESQAKLESEIHGAISSLQREMKEITNIFERRNQTHNSSPWYF